MKKETPIQIATKTINEVFAIMSTKALYGDLLDCLQLLGDARLKLDRLSAAKAKQKDMTMKQREDQTTIKLKSQLAGLEKEYIHLARVNPQSINDTQQHLQSIDKLVRDMKRIRGRLGMFSKSDAFLKELLYPQNGPP